MSIATEKFIATLKLIEGDGTATRYFRDFLARVDSFIQAASEASSWGGITGTLADQTDLQSALDNAAAYAPADFRDEATDPYTLVIGDANQVIRLTAADADVTIPPESSVNFPTGTEISLRFTTGGAHTLTTTGLTINGTVPTLNQHTELKFRKVGTDEWDLVRS